MLEAALNETLGSARYSRRAKGEAQQLLIDPERLALEPGKILVKQTAGGGYLCLGLGSSAEFLRKIDDEEDFVGSTATTDSQSILRKSPLASSNDPFLRRLGSAVSLAKDGFDPDQPRDERGRWSGNGAAGAAAATVTIADDIFSVPSLGTALRQLAARLLPAGATGPVAFFGTLFIPTNRSLISEGTLPDTLDLSYHFDQGTGVLSLTRSREDGGSDVLFSGRPDADGLFHDSAGNIIGRHLGSSVVIDPDAVPGYRSHSSSDEEVGTEVQTRTDAITETNEPKLCPDVESDKSGWEKRKERSLAYQEQITGLPRGLAYELVDPLTGKKVNFDGCIPSTGTMQEAKGPGYLDQMIDSNNWHKWYEGVQEMRDQMDRQFRAAGGRLVEWHFAEEQVANYFRAYAVVERYDSIIVKWTPARVQ